MLLLTLLYIVVSKSEPLWFRAILIPIEILILYYLEKGIEKQDWMANYCGIFISSLMYFHMTEVNLKFERYRLHEGYLLQISAAFSFSTCVTTNWKTLCINQCLLHLYGFIRLWNKFEDLSDLYYPGSLSSLVFFVFGSYCYSSILKEEFIASFNNVNTLKSQKKVINCLPEGVLIASKDNQYKYVNSKIKHILDIKKFYKDEDEKEILKTSQELITRELDNIVKNISSRYPDMQESDNEDSSRLLNKLLRNFTVTCKDTDFGQRKLGMLSDSQDYNDQPRMHRFGELLNVEMSLSEFLNKERKSLLDGCYCNKESKISVKYKSQELQELQDQRREFIIKTTIVEFASASGCDPSCIHMFIDTTQISQLEEAKAQNHYQRQMLSNVSHELRTPLNSIMASLELMRAEEYGKNNRFLHIASSSCTILGMLVEDILDHAKIESGVFQINEEVFTMTECIKEIKEVFILQANGKGLELKMNIQDKLKKLPIFSDKQRLKQVLMNLVSNSLKFTDRGFITIDISEKSDLEESKVFEESKSYEERQFLDNSLEDFENESMECFSENSALQMNRNDCTKYLFHAHRSRFNSLDEEESDFSKTMSINLKVIDTGIGISQADQRSLFKLFGKLSSNHNRNKTGCGLGLTICKKIIEKLGGTINLFSEENVGTTVECHFTCKY
ncbi:unnamed protein product [Moneuplotes crassus]|uniref:histidine kinase n=1 Tax=Euplotes crassus TaxID=5936 RepID=A0AAD1XV04_EUPCR|nr:unnamed protein product [Moneuplotes crassus]